jgi:opacity protein-like surface antigen
MRKAMVVAVAAAMLAPALAKAAPRLEVEALGGYRTFTGDAGDVLDGGPAYGAGLRLGLTPWVGLEGWYQGAAFRTSGALPFDRTRVWENGVAAMLKVGPQHGRLRPYAFGGLGWNWLRTDEDNPFVQDQNYLTVPVGAGLDFALARMGRTDVTLGARASYRFGFGEDAFLEERLDRNDQFQVGAVLGAQF